MFESYYQPSSLVDNLQVQRKFFLKLAACPSLGIGRLSLTQTSFYPKYIYPNEYNELIRVNNERDRDQSLM